MQCAGAADERVASERGGWDDGGGAHRSTAHHVSRKVFCCQVLMEWTPTPGTGHSLQRRERTGDGYIQDTSTLALMFSTTTAHTLDTRHTYTHALARATCASSHCVTQRGQLFTRLGQRIPFALATRLKLANVVERLCDRRCRCFLCIPSWRCHLCCCRCYRSTPDTKTHARTHAMQTDKRQQQPSPMPPAKNLRNTRTHKTQHKNLTPIDRAVAGRPPSPAA